MDIKVTKSQAEVYTIRILEHRDWWIQATLIEDRGYLALNTSHGDWSYTWSCPGMPFKDFLICISDSYLMNKLGGIRTFFNSEKTFIEIKKTIIDSRKDKELTAEEAREIFNSLDSMDCSSEINFWRSIEDLPDVFHRKIFSYDYSSIPCIKEHNPSLQLFVKEMWPGFVQALKDERENLSH